MPRKNQISNYKTSEKWLEAQLVKRVKAAGGHALKFASDTEIGYPDRLVLMPGGKAYWVEMKSTGEKPRLIQKIRHDELRKLGFEVHVISNEEQLNKFINHITQNQDGTKKD